MKHKKDPSTIASYRPVHNLPFLSKLIELSCLKQLENFISNFDLIPKFQSAYRKNFSVETSVLRIYNDMLINKSRGKQTLLILLDLTSAFDLVDQHILLNDLRNMGIGGVVHDWFKSYLLDRKYYVQIGQEHSDCNDMNTGIPQGSILAPTLFTIYTAELYYILEGHKVESHFYADDTQILFEVNDPTDATNKLTEVLNSVKVWMNSRKLKLNIDKTEAILILTNSRNQSGRFSSLDIDGSVLELSNPVRSLGVLFDEHLTMKHQLNSVKKKTIYNLMNISRISKFINQSCRLKLVHNLIFSHLDFCNSLYFNLPNRDLRNLQLILNSAARIVVGMPVYSRERITPVNISLHFLPVKARIIFKICTLTYKALNEGDPAYLADLLSFHNVERTLRTHREGLLQEPIVASSSYSDRCFMSCAPRLYNSLSSTIRSAPNIDLFKKQLKAELFRRSYDMDSLVVRPELSL